jgi:2-methylaconitate cis-trans-isomerase PrpF
MSSAIGPYAYNAGLLEQEHYGEPNMEVKVRIRNTNTGQMIKSTFEVVGGQPAVHGDYSIDGVAGKESKIKIEFMFPHGSKTGRVLPTGHVKGMIEACRVTCVDSATPTIFVRADDVGIDVAILPITSTSYPTN